MSSEQVLMSKEAFDKMSLGYQQRIMNEIYYPSYSNYVFDGLACLIAIITSPIHIPLFVIGKIHERLERLTKEK